MKRFACCVLILVTVGLIGLRNRAWGQGIEISSSVPYWKRSLSGPRLGMTLIPGDGLLYQNLKSRGAGRLISQFGWHFEHQVLPSADGPAFVIEWIPLLGGVEYGMFIPSLTLAFGIRLPEGFEFGLGPNLLFGGREGMNTALVLAVGKTFNFEGVNIPVNLAYVNSPLGTRIGLVFGYAIHK